MPYSYTRSVALPRSSAAQWVEPNLASTPLRDMYATYEHVILVLTHSALTGERFVDMDQYRLLYSTSLQTVSQWLSTTIGDNTLEYIDNLPNNPVGHIKYAQAVQQRFKLGINTYSGVIPSDYSFGHTDIAMSRSVPYTNMDLLQQYALVTVNGYVHDTKVKSSTNELFVVNGARSARKARSNNVGILSLFKMGSMTKHRILTANIEATNTGEPLYDGITFTVPDLTSDYLDNKSYILVLGGYIVTVDNGNHGSTILPGKFWRAGSNVFRLNLNNLHYVERIIESSQYLDLFELGLTGNPADPRTIDINQIKTDVVVRKYLTMSQSFLVVLDSPNLQVSTIDIQDTHTPGHFLCSNEPKYPLSVGYGRLAEYNKELGDGKWALTMLDSYTRNFIFGRIRPPQNGLISDQLIPHEPYLSTSGKLLQFASYR